MSPLGLNKNILSYLKHGLLALRHNCVAVTLPGQESRLLVQWSVAPCLPVPGTEPVSGPEPAEESAAAALSHCVRAPSLNRVTVHEMT